MFVAAPAASLNSFTVVLYFNHPTEVFPAQIAFTFGTFLETDCFIAGVLNCNGSMKFHALAGPIKIVDHNTPPCLKTPGTNTGGLDYFVTPWASATAEQPHQRPQPDPPQWSVPG